MRAIIYSSTVAPADMEEIIHKALKVTAACRVGEENVYFVEERMAKEKEPGI